MKIMIIRHGDPDYSIDSLTHTHGLSRAASPALFVIIANANVACFRKAGVVFFQAFLTVVFRNDFPFRILYTKNT